MVLPRIPRALLFDVFGTCVDWRKTVTDALEQAYHAAINSPATSIPSKVRTKEMTHDSWGKFAQEWRNTYKEFTRSFVKEPGKPWKSVDEHHHEALNELLKAWELEGLWSPNEVRGLSLIWHKLEPWADSAQGIKDLSSAFWTGTLSNGNLSLLGDLTVFANLKFTHIFSAENFGAYKPSPDVYIGAAEQLGINSIDCVMVACHLNDLMAAKSCGYQTIYVERPLEEDWDTEKVEREKKAGWVDLWIPMGDGNQGFITVAEKLGL